MGRIKDEELFQMIHDYLKDYLPKQRGSSPNTIRAYRTAIEQFLDFTAEQQGITLTDVTFDMLNCENLTNFLKWLITEKGCSSATRNHRLASIRSFFSYVAAGNPENIFRQVSLSKIPKQKTDKFAGVEYMSEDAVQAVLKQPNTQTRLGVRDQFFMILLYDTGARIQEMLDLKVCDIKVGKVPVATLLGKGSKVRSVPLMPETMAHYQNYMNLFHSDEKRFSTEPLFYVERYGMRNPMSDDNVRKFLRKYGAVARRNCPDVPTNIHPHLWRHSRAMHLYQHGMDLTLISQWLGHSNLETTLIYAHADTEQKRKAIEKSMGRKVTGGIDIPRYSVTDEDTIKRLYGLK